jgi:hypothetical protein
MMGGFRRVTQAMRRVVCWLYGHDTILQFEHHRICLRCMDCGHETRGWTIGAPHPSEDLTVSTPTRIETRHAA